METYTVRVSFMRFLLVGLFVAFAFSAAHSLDRDRTIKQLYHTAWTARDGAPERIRAFAQGDDGYLWLGASTGLYKFDGLQFDAYLPHTGTFPSSNISSLLFAPDGGLWIGYWFGGASLLKDGTLTNYGELEGLPPGRLATFAKDHEGTVWAASARGLARFEGTGWQAVGAEWNFPGQMAQTVFVDRAGTLWTAAEDMIVFLPKGARLFQQTGEKIGQVLGFAQAPDGTIWMAETTRSVRPISLGGTDGRTLGPEIEVGARELLFDREGSLWAVTLADGIRRVPYTDSLRGKKIAQFGTEVEIFTEGDGLSGDYIWATFEDREGNIWMGTANGLDRFRESAIVPVRFPPGEIDYGLMPGDNGDVFALSRAVWLLRGRAPAPVDLKAGRPRAVSADNERTIWTSDYDALVGLTDGARQRKVLPIPFTIKVIEVFTDRDSRVWVYCSANGLYQHRDGTWVNYDKQSQLPKATPIGMLVDASNRMWFGYPGNVIAVIDGDRVSTFSGSDGVQAGDIKAFYEHAGRIWAAGTLGVAVLENDRFRMLAAEGTDALTGVSGIVGARDGSVWLNSSRGIIHISTDEVRASLENPAHIIRYRVFDALDGLPGAAQQNRPFPTAIEGSDGRLWFSTNKGIAWIDPGHVSRNRLPPPVSIRSLSSDEQMHDALPSQQLPQGTTSLRINYTAPSLSIPERVRFRYRLDGVENDWQEAGTRREAYYTNLGPGSYRFHVVAANGDGIWNERGAMMDFQIMPMFYQTNWFILLCVAAAGYVAWLVYKWRVRVIKSRLQMQFDERLSERTRLAQDLHDTLLQGFVSASMQIDVVVDQLAPDSPVKPRLDRIHELMGHVIEEGRNTVRGLRSSSADRPVDLEQEFARIREELDTSERTEFRIIVEGGVRPLYPAINDEVCHIGHEAIVNAFRHSGADLIEVEIEYAVRTFRLLVRDNGSGIDQEILNSGREGHWGLSGMRERAEKIGAALRVWSSPAAGTEIELSVPRRVAYPGQSSWWSKMFKQNVTNARVEKEKPNDE